MPRWKKLLTFQRQNCSPLTALTKKSLKPCVNRARDAILTITIAAEEKLGEVSEDMRNLDGVDSDMLRKLAETGVTQRDDLAELSVDELVEITGVDEKKPKK